MLLDHAGLRYALNVEPMVCIKPRDGSPRCALISVRLIAFGLPPDSWFMRRSTVCNHEPGCPSAANACRINGAHCATPALALKETCPPPADDAPDEFHHSRIF